MKDYENTALNFYDDIHILNAVSENSALSQKQTPEEETQFQKNTFLIENRLYDLRQNQKNIVNIQFVTPDCQYHMVEENGFQRGGTIRDLDSFYQSEFYLLPQEKGDILYGWTVGNRQGFFIRMNRMYTVLPISSLLASPFMDHMIGNFLVSAF